MRASLSGVSWLAMPATWSGGLHDLSVGGLAFVSAYPIEVGRTASVRALTPAVVASCDRASFDELLRPLFADDA